VRGIEEALVKRTLERFGDRVAFASMFGSYVRGEDDAHSDLDVLVVCRDWEAGSLLNAALTRLGRRIGRRIHVNIYLQNSLEERLRRHDYLIASMLEDSVPILGWRNLEEARSRILNGLPDGESISFNRTMGWRILTRTKNQLKRYIEAYQPLTAAKEPLKGNLLRTLEDYQVGLGYLTASLEMERLGRVVTFRRLLSLDSGLPLKNLLNVERSLRRGWEAPSLRNPILGSLAELRRLTAGWNIYPARFLRSP